MLEDFLKSRAGEIMGAVSTSPLSFELLPSSLQELSTGNVVTALRFQTDLRTRAKEDPLPLIRRAARSLASTAEHPYVLSDLAFGHARSNVGHQDVFELLKAFNVADAWNTATLFARRMGLAPISVRDDFVEASRRRHRAAHVASADTPLGDLQNFPPQALGIAASIDALLTRAAYELVRSNTAYARGGASLTQASIGLRFLDSDGAVFRDIGEGKSRASKKSADRTLVLARSQAIAASTGAVIVYRAHGTPSGWECTDLTPGRP